MKYYHVRVTLLSGTPLDGYACQGLSQAVACLNKITGKQWPYQVIHRAVRAGSCWGQAYEQSATSASDPPEAKFPARRVFVSIEDAGKAPCPELPDFVQPVRPAAELAPVRLANSPATQPFVQQLHDAILVTMWVPEVTGKGVPHRNAPIFQRLEKA